MSPQAGPAWNLLQGLPQIVLQVYLTADLQLMVLGGIVSQGNLVDCQHLIAIFPLPETIQQVLYVHRLLGGHAGDGGDVRARPPLKLGLRVPKHSCCSYYENQASGQSPPAFPPYTAFLWKTWLQVPLVHLADQVQ